jgi:TRAP-type mannitol/chloroaromatic compound transport system permease large subunit
MNAKGNSIEIVSVLIASGRIRRLGQAVPPTSLFRVVPADRAGHSAAGLWYALAAPDLQAGEFWETLSYVTIWLCGWVSIALCVLCAL